MKKLLSVLAFVAMTTSLSAMIVFCDPASDIESGFADSWENACAPSAMPLTLTAMYPGDTLVIKGGVIKIKTRDDIWEIPSGITVIGGFDPALTGTDVTMPKYPSATPTIFDGDNNNNGIADTLDAEALIRVNLENNMDQICTLQGLVLRNTFHANLQEGSDDLQAYMLYTSALRLICGTTFVKNCEIYNHKSTLNEGSQSIMVVGAQAHFIDCDVHHGVSKSRGGLMRLRDYYINKVKEDVISPSVVVERCSFHDGSSLGGRKLHEQSGTYGGAIHCSSGDLFVINSTFVLDSCYSKGGAIRPNPAGLTLISCTLGQNVGSRSTDPDPYNDKQYSFGSSVGADTETPLRFMNTIMLDDKDGGSKRNAPLYTDDNYIPVKDYFYSNDYNILGTCYLIGYGNRYEIDSEDYLALWKSHDQHDVTKNNDFTRLFGDVYTNLKDNGGCSKSIMPLEMQYGASVADLQAYADQFCPDWTSVDASVDQRGYKRDVQQTCVGALAKEAEAPSALFDVTKEVGSSEYFNILGQPINDSYKGIVIQKGHKYLIQ